jgi:hypothetical protein
MFLVPGVASPQKQAATRRNDTQLDAAVHKDTKIMSKYLPSDPTSYNTMTATGPNNHFTPPAWLMKAIKEVAHKVAPTPNKPPPDFQMNQEAATHNLTLLKKCGFDFGQFLQQHQAMTLNYGSEFQPIGQLEKILGRHPNFAELKTILAQGMEYRFATNISKETRALELAAIVEQGNHQLAEHRSAHVVKALGKDVAHGFSMSILPATVTQLHGAMAQPLGMADKLTVLESGARVPKYRLTQDLSFSLTKEKVLVNSQINMSAYVEMIYAWCLPQIIHYIVALQQEHPDQCIFISKYDYSDTYRRISHSATAAVQSIALFAGFAFIALLSHSEVPRTCRLGVCSQRL